jgi:hypothetical protein
MTSVEWLEYKTQNSKWLDLTLNERKEIIQQAKEMHKVEIIDAWIATDNELQRLAAEQYYNKTFNK